MKVALVADVKWAPSMNTNRPELPMVGEKSLIQGPAPITTKDERLFVVPSAVVTVIGPFVAPAGTRAVRLVPPVNKLTFVEGVPPNFTASTFVK